MQANSKNKFRSMNTFIFLGAKNKKIAFANYFFTKALLVMLRF